MSLVDRAKNILLKPVPEWDVVAGESASVGGIFTNYAVPLSVLPLVGTVLAVGLLGIGADSLAAIGVGSLGIGAALGMGAVAFVLGLVVLFAMSFIVNAVSPSFNGKSDLTQATKLMAYASTPSWVAGFIAPFLGSLGGFISFAAIGYVVYLIYTGVKPVLGIPQEKVAGFTVVIVLIYIVLSFVISMIIGGLLIAALLGGGMMAGAMGA